MLWRLVVICGLFWGTMQVVYGDEEPVVAAPATAEAVLNDPSETVSLARTIINRIQPSYETVWDMWNGDFYQGVSGSLYNFASREIPIGSVRLGVSTGMALYSGVSLDLPGITQRFVPKIVKDTASVGPLDEVWGFIGKYGRVGIVGGYSWDHADPVAGVTVGAAVSF